MKRIVILLMVFLLGLLIDCGLLVLADRPVVQSVNINECCQYAAGIRSGVQ